VRNSRRKRDLPKKKSEPRRKRKRIKSERELSPHEKYEKSLALSFFPHHPTGISPNRP